RKRISQQSSVLAGNLPISIGILIFNRTRLNPGRSIGIIIISLPNAFNFVTIERPQWIPLLDNSRLSHLSGPANYNAVYSFSQVLNFIMEEGHIEACLPVEI